jgi:hypothetical protein
MHFKWQRSHHGVGPPQSFWSTPLSLLGLAVVVAGIDLAIPFGIVGFFKPPFGYDRE